MIKTIVADVREKSAYGKDFTALIIQNIEDTLKKENKYSVQDLVNGVNTEWGPEVQQWYENIVKSTQEASEFLKPEAIMFAFVAAGAFSVGLVAYAADVFVYGTGVCQCKLVTQAILEFSSGKFSSGWRLLKASRNLSRLSRFKPPVGFKILKFLKWGGGVLTAISFLVEFGLGIYAAFAGAENRAALQAAIKDLCSRRFAIKCIQSLHDIYRDSLQGMYTHVVATRSYQRRLRDNEITQEFYDQRMKIRVKNTVGRIKKISEGKLKFAEVWDNLAKLDDDDDAYRADDVKEKDMRASLDSGIVALLDKEAQNKLEDKVHKNSVSFDPAACLPDSSDVEIFAAGLSKQEAEGVGTTEEIQEPGDDDSSDLSDESDDETAQ
ncbi:hypothetical protein BDV29DRAFT_57358 [Aspergillus leporis]|uniref:Uncharacterized protein n=1 Tax=Aspergillus leporis TaxID=41062 RepID=A0A5N5WN40_9EURO|nr:hypothetical protein BDV29DRAFT_57358 [Aspergillus leporis]